jgi:hypothetical protein
VLLGPGGAAAGRAARSTTRGWPVVAGPPPTRRPSASSLSGRLGTAPRGEPTVRSRQGPPRNPAETAPDRAPARRVGRLRTRAPCTPAVLGRSPRIAQVRLPRSEAWDVRCRRSDPPPLGAPRSTIAAVPVPAPDRPWGRSRHRSRDPGTPPPLGGCHEPHAPTAAFRDRGCRRRSGRPADQIDGEGRQCSRGRIQVGLPSEDPPGTVARSDCLRRRGRRRLVLPAGPPTEEAVAHGRRRPRQWGSSMTTGLEERAQRGCSLKLA